MLKFKQKRDESKKNPQARRRLWLCVAAGAISVLSIAGGILLLSAEQQAQADSGIRRGTNRLAVTYEYEYNPNDLYTQPKPGDKEVRIASYVKSMRFHLNQTLTGLEEFATESEITAQAQLVARASDTNKYIDPDFIVWQKEEELLAPKKVSGTSLEQVITVDVNRYLNYSKEVYDQTKANTANELKLIFKATTTVQGPMGPGTDTETVEYTIPMLENLIVVQGTPEAEKQLQIPTRPPVNRMSLLPFAVAAFVLAVAAALFAMRMAIPPRIPDGANLYRKNLERIFHQYGERLVRLEMPLPYRQQPAIQIAGIAEMVKIADEISQPIFYHRVDGDTESRIEFYVFDNGYIYYMVLMAETVCLPENAVTELPV